MITIGEVDLNLGKLIGFYDICRRESKEMSFVPDECQSTPQSEDLPLPGLSQPPREQPQYLWSELVNQPGPFSAIARF